MAKVNLPITGNANELIKALQDVRVGLDAIKKDSADFGNDIKKGFSDAGKNTKTLNTELNKTAKAIDEVEKEFKELGATTKTAVNPNEIKQGTKEIDNLGKSSSKLGGIFKSAFAPLLGIFGAGALITSSIGKIREFNKSLDELASITGLDQASEGFQTLEEEAKRLGSTTTLSASEVVNAFKSVGSAKPELLENADALSAVTEQAIILSQASGEDLGTSVGTLTDILNQFGLGAEETQKTIDQLANGSQQGAADIGNIGDAIVNFGVKAREANVNVNESVTAIELLAGQGIKGSEAGTALATVFSKLNNIDALGPEVQKGIKEAGVNLDIVTDTTKSFEDRLRELSKVQEISGAQFKLFGQTGTDAASILFESVNTIENGKSAFESFGKSLETSGTALAQSNQNTDNLDGALKGLNSAWEGLILSFSGADGPLKDIVNSLSDVVRFVTDNIDVFVELGKVLVASAGAFKAFQFVKGLKSSFLGAADGAKGFIGGIKGIGAAISANPLGALLTVIPLLIAGFEAVSGIIDSFSAELSDAELSIQTYNEAQEEAIKTTAKDQAAVNSLISTVQNKTLSDEQRKQALEELNAISPEYFSNLSLEESSLATLTERSDAYLKSLVDIARQKALNAKLEEQTAALIEEETKSLEENVNATTVGLSVFSDFFNGRELGTSALLDAQQVQKENIESINREIDATTGLIQKEKELEEERANFSAFRGIVDNLGTASLEQFRVSQQELEKQEAAATAESRKRAEQRAKDRLAEANALFKVEQDLQSSIDSLQEKAEQARLDELTGQERIDAEKQIALDTITEIEDGIARKIALVQFEAELTKAEISKLTEEEKEARIQGIQDTVELNDEQQALIGELKRAAIKDANDKSIEFIAEENKRVRDAELASVGEQETSIDLAEETAIAQVETDSLGFDSEIAAEQFKEEQILRIKQQFLDERIALIEQENILKQQALQAELDALEGKEGAEIDLRRQTLQTQIDNQQASANLAIKNIENEGEQIQQGLDDIKENKSKFNLSDALGLTAEEFDAAKGALQEFGGAIIDELNGLLSAQLDANSKLIDGIQGDISETEDALDREIAKREAGYASNIEGKEAELANLKQQEEAAQAEREKLLKQQLILDTVTQASGLISTSVNLLKGFSQIPIVGLPLGIAAVAAMLGFFAKAKASAFQAAGFAHGGYTGDGQRLQEAGTVHKGEYVFTQEKTKKHRGLFDAIHNDDRFAVNRELNEMLKGTGVYMEPEIATRYIDRKQVLSDAETQRNESIINAKVDERLKSIDDKFDKFIKSYNGKEERFETENQIIIKKGNKTKYIKKRG